jgi:hypothetical protein
MPQTIADRIQKAARLRGHTSDRSKSGVDIQKLADATGSSYEMARRYAEGAAVPPPDAVREIGRWLKVSVTWLLFGDGAMEGASSVDVTTLQKCLEVALDAQRIAGVTLPSARLALLVAGLYKQATKGSAPAADSVAATLGALAT